MTLTTELNTLTMESTSLNVERFGYLLLQKHDLILEIKKKAKSDQSENELIALLLNGLLLPEFKAIVVYLRMQPATKLNKYMDCFQQVISFATDNSILDLQRGKKLFLGKATNKGDVCRNYLAGKCKRGPKCRFEHPSGQEGTKKGNKVKKDKSDITCYGCQQKGHYKNECPAKKDDDSSPTAPTDAPEVKTFMMKATEGTVNDDEPPPLVSRVFYHRPDSTPPKEGEEIILDSGSTHHINPWEDAFIPGSIRPCNYTIQVGDGSSVKHINKKGSVFVRPLPRTLPGFILADVLLLPTCPYFIVSLAKMDKGGCGFKSSLGRATVSTVSPNGTFKTPVLHAEVRGSHRLYHVLAEKLVRQPPGG